MIELGPPIGVGRTAEVFPYGEGRIVKLLRPGFPDRLAEREAALSVIVAERYPAAPRCDGAIRVANRLGIVFERVDGESMEARIRSHLRECDRLARDLGRLHARLHLADGAGLPDQRAAIHAAISRAEVALPASAADAAHRRVDELPAGHALCHGDLHPANVLLGPRTVVIDWDNARSGNPDADVARSIFLIRDAAMLDAVPRALRIAVAAIRGRFCRAYLAAYRAMRPLDPAAVDAWRLPVLAARLAEDIEAERGRLLAEIEELVGWRARTGGPGSGRAA